MSISGWATHRATLESEVSPNNKDTPVLFCYGDEDPVIGLELSKASASLLSEVLEKVSVIVESRDMHQPNPGEMKAAEEFMIRCLGSDGGGGSPGPTSSDAA